MFYIVKPVCDIANVGLCMNVCEVCVWYKVFVYVVQPVYNNVCLYVVYLVYDITWAVRREACLYVVKPVSMINVCLHVS